VIVGDVGQAGRGGGGGEKEQESVVVMAWKLVVGVVRELEERRRSWRSSGCYRMGMRATIHIVGEYPSLVIDLQKDGEFRVYGSDIVEKHVVNAAEGGNQHHVTGE